MPEGEAEGAWIVVGSNFGRTGHPAWTANLPARGGEAVVNRRGRDIPVRATLLEGEERARVWEAALAFWPPYAAYERRVERQIRLFRLERRQPEERRPGVVAGNVRGRRRRTTRRGAWVVRRR